MTLHRFSVSLLIVALILCSDSVNAGAFHAAVLPISEGGNRARSNSFLATLINDTDRIARNCRIEIADKHKLRLSYWTTDQTDNHLTGRRDQPADIWPRSSQSFYFRLNVYGKPPQSSGAIYPIFQCDGHPPAIQIAGINDVRLERFDFDKLSNISDEELALLTQVLRQLENPSLTDPSTLSESEVDVLRGLATLKE